VAIDLRELPREVRDIIELREGTDQTFARFADEDYSEVFWNMLAERADKNVEHSFIGSIYGVQGSGKCFEQSEKVFSNRGIIEGSRILVGDKIRSELGDWVGVKSVWSTKKRCAKIRFDYAYPVIASYDHCFPTLGGLLKVNELKKGDLIPVAVPRIDEVGVKDDYEFGYVLGAYAADGSAVLKQRLVAAKRRLGLRKNGCNAFIQIANNNKEYLEYIAELMRKNLSFTSVVVRSASGKGRWTLVAYGKDEVEMFIERCGARSSEKVIPSEVLRTMRGIRGYIDGYCNGDMTCNVVRSKKGTFKCELGWLFKSRAIAVGFIDMLHIVGVWPSIRERILRSGRWKGNSYVRVTVPAKQIVDFLNGCKFNNSSKKGRVDLILNHRASRVEACLVETNDKKSVVVKMVHFARVLGVEDVGEKGCVDVEVDSKRHLFTFAGGLVSHNSMAAISICKFLDPDFKVENIFFDYNDLVYNRHKLKENSAVLIDEQSQSYGLDSHRVMIILSSLKEQLRKKSIHFVFCSPVLYEESKSSMYLIETMFIDYETQECYAALKTREGLTLGHIRVPYPMKQLPDGTQLATDEFVKAYQLKKDRHLDRVLGNRNVDIFEERANAVMKNALFRKAEKIYKSKMGYIPNGTLVQIINKIYPEFNAGVVPMEIAGRIKLNKEMSGEWECPVGTVRRKDRQDHHK